MARLTWDAIRRSLGIPEPEPAGDGRTPARGGRSAAGARDKALDMELAAAVSVSPAPAEGGRRVTISYSGTLAQQGAQDIYLHYGYGPGEWEDVQEAPMRPVGTNRFQASIPVRGDGRLEFCFRDGSGRWDNNGGRNWSYAIPSEGASSS